MLHTGLKLKSSLVLKIKRGLYPPEIHKPLWLKFGQQRRITDCTGDVQAAIECEHYVASLLIAVWKTVAATKLI